MIEPLPPASVHSSMRTLIVVLALAAAGCDGRLFDSPVAPEPEPWVLPSPGPSPCPAGFAEAPRVGVSPVCVEVGR